MPVIYELTQVTERGVLRRPTATTLGSAELHLQLVERADVELVGQLHVRQQRQHADRCQRKELHLGFREPDGLGHGAKHRDSDLQVRSVWTKNRSALGTMNCLYDGNSCL